MEELNEGLVAEIEEMEMKLAEAENAAQQATSGETSVETSVPASVVTLTQQSSVRLASRQSSKI